MTTRKAQFVVVGSGGGGGTISWLLAKAGLKVMLLEQGPDISKTLDKPFDGADEEFNPIVHDEYFFRIKKPDPKRRLRGDYNTRRDLEPTDPTRTAKDSVTATPFSGPLGGWTGSVLGGGSVLWGTWAFRALPLDFKLRTLFADLKQIEDLDQARYSVVDWPIEYKELQPFYDVAETLLAVSGDRQSVIDSMKASAWYQAFSGKPYFGTAAEWEPKMDFPAGPYPRTPVGQFVFEGMEAAGCRSATTPVAIVRPGSGPYRTREALARMQNQGGGPQTGILSQPADDLWSERVRSACNMCGFCGEYLCWGKQGPKSGTHVTTLRELRDLEAKGVAEIVCDAKVFEVMYDRDTRRATGVRYLDVSDPDNPETVEVEADFVIVSCGAVQTSRLLLMSGPPGGLGNSSGMLGRNAMFHLFGMGATATLTSKFQGYLHGEFGHTGNTTSYDPYFVQDPTTKKWSKGGILASAARKNPLENAVGLVEGKTPLVGLDLLLNLERYARSMQVRLMGDDLPMPRNRVDLDPTFVDEYGFPVARITRKPGKHEEEMDKLVNPSLFEKVFTRAKSQGLIDGNVQSSSWLPFLLGDHQMGTCRMGHDDDPANSVLDTHCRLHDAKNVFVVDSSFMPTGFGLNPMVTVVANALRVGTWIVQQCGNGSELA